MALRGSFFGKMLGLTTPEQDSSAAEDLVKQDRFLEARALFERAAANGTDEIARGKWQERARQMRDLAAEQMLTRADGLQREGQLEAARVEWRNAAETAHSEVIRAKAEQALEASDPVLTSPVQTETLSDDQRWAVLVGTWSDAALDESDRYGEVYRQAILKMHDGEYAGARAVFEALLAEHQGEAVYLWLEAGRCASRAGDAAYARTALATFLERVNDEPNAAQVDAYVALAELHALADDVALGIETLSTAVEKMPEHPLPLIALGSFMRRHGFAEEAVSVLGSADAMLDTLQPDWVLLTEYGLALRAHGDKDKALEKLEQAFAVFSSRRILDVPPMLGMALAELHEETGGYTRAADLYRLLVNGSDRNHRVSYLRGAARNLERIGLEDEARRLELRAQHIERPENKAEVSAP